MHHHDLSRWQHEHRYTTGSPVGERRTLLVTGLTAAMMVLEIVAGHFLHSMALFADGWHMGMHVVALGISAFASVYARHPLMSSRVFVNLPPLQRRAPRFRRRCPARAYPSSRSTA